MNPSLLILFFLADNRKYMLSRWDFSVQIQLRSATSQCVSHEKTTAGLPQRQGCIAPESVESISNTIKKETEVSLGLIIFVLL